MCVTDTQVWPKRLDIFLFIQYLAMMVTLYATGNGVEQFVRRWWGCIGMGALCVFALVRSACCNDIQPVVMMFNSAC